MKLYLAISTQTGLPIPNNRGRYTFITPGGLRTAMRHTLGVYCKYNGVDLESMYDIHVIDTIHAIPYEGDK